LSVSGVLLQAYFQNAMAGPYVIGVSSGSGLAVVVATLVAGGKAPHTGATMLASILGGLGIVTLVSLISERMRSRRTETLLLIGLALSAVCSAITSVLLLLLPRGPEGVLVWLMGSLATATWSHSILVVGGLLPGLLLGFWNARALDAILWGDEIARSVGVNVSALRRITLIAATLPVAAAVAVAGVIGFLGLMVPHIARGLVGPGHTRLLPISALFGAAWLVTADLLARVLIAPAEIPVGAITSAVGAPFLIWVCYRRR
jgi:iron complex transport system permease protein